MGTPAPGPARLGSGRVRLDDEVVHLRPGRLRAWRGADAVTLAYSDIASAVLTEPEGFHSGSLVLRLDSGESFSMTFGSGRLPAMKRSYRELWRRVQAARGEGHARGE